MGIVLGFLRLLPMWVWPVLGLVGYAAWNKHAAESAQRKLVRERESAAVQRVERERDEAAARAQAIHAGLVEQARQFNAQTEVSHAAELQARRARADADALRADRERLLVVAQDAAAAARAAAAAASAAGGRPPAGDPAGVLADVFGRCTAQLERVAAIADERGIRGLACQRSYEALTPPDGAAPVPQQSASSAGGSTP